MIESSFCKKELEDLRTSRVCAVEKNILINDFVARKKTLRDKFTHF